MMSERGMAAQRPYEREDELVEGLLQFDASAWRQLFEENYQRVYGYAYLRLGNATDAEDVASSVFSEAVKGIRSFRYRGIPIAAWLFRIAHHETVNAIKRRKQTPAPLDPESAGNGHEELRRSDERHDLGIALAALKEEHRTVLLLRFIEDRSIRDTAEVLGKSEGAVKLLQLRALRSLRKRLGGTHEGG
jgi:RNA polymerase sigma-70 factor (ECF subfamily)